MSHEIIPGREEDEWDEDDEEDQYYYQWDFEYDKGNVGHYLSWTSIGLIIVVLIIILVVGRYIYQRRETIRFYLGKITKKTPKKDTELELVEPNAPIEE